MNPKASGVPAGEGPAGSRDAGRAQDRRGAAGDGEKTDNRQDQGAMSPRAGTGPAAVSKEQYLAWLLRNQEADVAFWWKR